MVRLAAEDLSSLQQDLVHLLRKQAIYFEATLWPTEPWQRTGVDVPDSSLPWESNSLLKSFLGIGRSSEQTFPDGGSFRNNFRSEGPLSSHLKFLYL